MSTFTLISQFPIRCVTFLTSNENVFLYDGLKERTFTNLGGSSMANNKKHQDNNLKGTLWATFGVGFVIILFWIIAFTEFINRF